MKRRSFLAGTGAALTAGLTLRTARELDEAGCRADVFIARASSYSANLDEIIRAGLSELGVGPAQVKGKSVLLKPNLVEPLRAAPHINTHPAVVRAVSEVFRSWLAREVIVAEGQGHCRDSDYVLCQSGLGEVLDESGLEFIDLNHDDLVAVPNALGLTAMRSLVLPATLRRADLIVSIAKMKTHHWAGVTLSLKNLFGVMPGVYYGWPKNVLHHMGIPESILDIASTVRPHLAIVDGIVGMEGDGPIMGTPKNSGVLVMGRNLPAVDATCARIMGVDPHRIAYLAGASGRLGPIAESHIVQRGETLASHIDPYQELIRMDNAPS